MSDQAAPDSPFVTYPPDAARPGFNYRDHYPDSPDPEYVPIQGDEDYVESNSTNLEDSVEMSMAPPTDISQRRHGRFHRIFQIRGIGFHVVFISLDWHVFWIRRIRIMVAVIISRASSVWRICYKGTIRSDVVAHGGKSLERVKERNLGRRLSRSY